MSERVIYVVRSWPRLSQTFIVNEVLALERLGMDLAIFSLVRSGETLVQPQVAEVRASVTYLQDLAGEPLSARARAAMGVFALSPRRFLRTLLLSLARPGLAAGYGEKSTMACFADAVALAAAATRMTRSAEPARHVHAHFAHDPALVGLLAGRLLDLPFSFTAHARDLLQIPAGSLAARTREAEAVVTCCEANAEYIRSTVPAADRPPVMVIHHGVELERFAPVPRGAAGEAPAITSIGRLVEKKGFEDLLRALATLRDREVEFRCRIYGEGPLQERLSRLRDRLGLREHVNLMGARDSDEVVAALATTDVFALTPTVTDDGDRDGIPNVLVEAMACALPVVTTAVGGIPELVENGVNGALVAPGDPAGVADALQQLLDDPSLRSRLGAAARIGVEDAYDVDKAARRLRDVFHPRTGAELETAPC